MYGLIISLILGLAVYYGGQPSTWPEVYFGATGFLWWWSVVTSSIGIIITIAMAAMGRMDGWILRGNITRVMVFLITRVAVSLAGVYLLSRALTETSSGVEWNTFLLYAGGIFYALSLVSMIKRSSRGLLMGKIFLYQWR